MATLTYAGELTVLVCWCGMRHAVPEELQKEQLRTGLTVYCPLGHGHVPSAMSETSELKRKLQWAKDDAARERQRADQAEMSRRAWKGQTTKLRNRVANGQCPFCGKTLIALDLHIARMHPDEKPRELAEEDATA